jgi:hypothetical protein
MMCGHSAGAVAKGKYKLRTLLEGAWGNWFATAGLPVPSLRGSSHFQTLPGLTHPSKPKIGLAEGPLTTSAQ